MARQSGEGAGPSRVLIADGDIVVRHALAEYLRDCGFHVIEASTLDEALALLEQPEAVRPELILSDVDLPGGNGFAFRAQVREQYPDIHFVLAGNIDTAVRSAEQMCEEHNPVAKPYHHQIVLDRIRRLLAGGN